MITKQSIDKALANPGGDRVTKLLFLLELLFHALCDPRLKVPERQEIKKLYIYVSNLIDNRREKEVNPKNTAPDWDKYREDIEEIKIRKA